MYAWHKCHCLIGTGTEAEFLVELWTGWTVLLQISSDSLDGVRELYCRIEVLPKKAALYFYCKGRGMLLGTEGAFRIPVDRDDSPRAWHLELEVCIVRHHIELYECSSLEQGLIATAERDYIKD